MSVRKGHRRALATFAALALLLGLLWWLGGLANGDLPFGPDSSSEGVGSGGEVADSEEGPIADESNAVSTSGAASLISELANTDQAISWRENEVEGELAEVASRLLEGYRDHESCLLRNAGYLDALGQVWGCVVEGPGWVDIVVVRSQAGSCDCSERIVRMRPDEWANDLENLAL